MIQLPSVTFVIVENRWPEKVEKFCQYVQANVKNAEIYVKDDLPKQNNKDAYDEFCSTRLHECFKTSHALVCQLDGFPVRWDKWDEDFLNYDYIGAPWPDGFLRAGGINSDARVGNGGCSLRSMRLCRALTNAKWVPMADDVFISAMQKQHLESVGARFADPMTAARFAIEFPNPEHNQIGQPFAFHDVKLHPQYKIF